MKIDRTKAAHWLYLALFAFNVVCAVLLRWLARRKNGGGLVLLYGHKLNGNLAAIYQEAGRMGGLAPPMAFLTMDPAYHRQLLSEGEHSVLAISPRSIPVLARAPAVISDHGLHALELMARLTDIGLFDVWHGIPFKGFDAQDFKVQHQYNEAWVASPLLKSMYEERFGFEPQQVQVTGYARTDRLVEPREPIDSLRARLGLERTRGRKVALFAPTWKQDASGRSLIPFGVDQADFFDALERVCLRSNAVVLFRAHLNSGAGWAATGDRIISVPHSEFPDTEGVLLLSDVLVCDWSSIAFDFLLLGRPTIFLDVPPPFAKGFSLGREYRFGAVVSSMEELLVRLEQGLLDPDAYRREFSAGNDEVKEKVYGRFADGRSASRCLDRLRMFLPKGESSR